MSVECNQTKMNLRVELDWRTTLATVLLFPTLVSLGFWQLERGNEKAGLIARLEERRLEPPMSLPAALRLPTDDLADRQVTFTGSFKAQDFVLLDNRLRDGRFGYEVVAFVSADALVVPLNLGWIEGDRSRMTTPSPELPDGEHTVRGRIYQPAGDAFMLGDNKFPKSVPPLCSSSRCPIGPNRCARSLSLRFFPMKYVFLPLSRRLLERNGPWSIKHLRNIGVMPSNGLLWHWLWDWPLFFEAATSQRGCAIDS
jgi:hypothetical protein